MLYNSFPFFIFFAIVVFFYYLVFKTNRVRIYFLTLASFVFYGYYYPPYLLLLFYSIAVNYYCAFKIDASNSRKLRKFFLLLAIFGNLSVLCFYKYANFLINILLRFFPSLTSNVSRDTLKFVLPLGISFFTFQLIGYTIDVYRREVRAEKNFIRVSFFTSFFTQLIAGPIMRAKEFFPQMLTKRQFHAKTFEAGLYFILWGLLKKVVIADNLAPLVDSYFFHPVNNFFSTWLAIYAFSFQIYCDFSGYCDIGIGCAKVLGYEIPLNFRQPYLSENITSFWHHWNITLSNWFRDYLFIPLGGSRCKESRYYFNLFVTMAVAGLWHGANYTFIIWGIYHGILLVSDKIIMKYSKVRIPRFISILVTFHLVCIGWIFFRASNVYLLKDILFNAFDIRTIDVFFVGNYYPLFFAALLLIMQIFERRYSLKQKFVYNSTSFKCIFVILAFLAIFLFGMSNKEFIYFDF